MSVEGSTMGSASHDVRIVVADSDPLFNEAITAVLDREPELVVMGQARSEFEAAEQAGQHRPDVILLAADLAADGPGPACMRIKARSPLSRVLVLTDKETPAVLIGALEGGASGYLSKDCAVAALIEATRAVYAGEMRISSHMSGELVAGLFQQRQETRNAKHRASRLSRREREILVLLADGKDNQSISRLLVISPKTVRTHIQNILKKLQVHSRLEAVAFARQLGLIGEASGEPTMAR